MAQIDWKKEKDFSPQSVPRRGELKFCDTSLASVPNSDDGCNKRTTPLQMEQNFLVSDFGINWFMMDEKISQWMRIFREKKWMRIIF